MLTSFDDVEYKWKFIINLVWAVLGNSSSFKTAEEFASHCFYQNVYPEDFINLSPPTIASKLSIKLEDAIILFLALQNWLNQTEFKSFDPNPIGLFSSSYEEQAIAHYGTIKFLDDEKDVHYGALAPSAFLLLELLANLRNGVVSNITTQTPTTSNYNLIDQVYIYITMLTFVFLLFTIVISFSQIWSITYSKSSLIHTASYASSPKPIRFSNIIAFVFSVMILEPARLASYYWNTKDTSDYFYVWVSIYGFFLILISLYNLFLILKVNKCCDKNTILSKQSNKIVNAIQENERNVKAKEWAQMVKLHLLLKNSLC